MSVAQRTHVDGPLRRPDPAGGARRLAALCAAWTCGLALAAAEAPSPPASAPASPDPAAFASDAVFQNYAGGSGLSSIYTNCLLQDARGYLWIGTQDGLNRWDGYVFRHYTAAKDDPRTIPDNMVLQAYTDLRGRLWVLTSTGLAAYDAEHDAFVRLDVRFDEIGVPKWLAQDDPDRLLLSTRRGLFAIDIRDGAAGSAPRALVREPSIPEAPATGLLRDRVGRLWISTPAGLFMRARPDARFSKFPLPQPDASPGMLAQAGGDKLWFASERGLFLIDPRAGAAQEIAGAREAIAALRTRPDCLAPLPDGSLWLCMKQGVLVLDPATSAAHLLKHDPLRPSSLGADLARDILVDHAGLVWVASDGGVGVHDPSGAGVRTVWEAGNVTNLLRLADGRILASDTRGHAAKLNLLDTALGRLEPFQPATRGLAGVGTQDAATELPDGTVLTGGSDGLSRWSADGRLLEHVDAPRDVSVLHVDRDRTVWIATYSAGLWRADLGARRLRPAPAPFAAALGEKNISAIADAPDGDLWIGTLDGLFRVDGRTHVPTRLDARVDGRRGSIVYISSLLTDPAGRLWIGTLGGGLYVSAPGDPAGAAGLRNIGVAQGLPDENVNMLLRAPSGEVWASTDRGIVELDPDARPLRTFGRKEGLGILEYWAHSGAVTPAGDVVFGGTDGLTWIRPGELRAWRYRPPTWPTSVQVGDGPRRSSAFADAIAHPKAAPVVLQPWADKIAVEFAALDLSSPADLVYRYRLDGYDDHWIDTDAGHRSAAYTNLKPGRYLLRLQGSNRNGEWGDEFGLAIVVLPAWYQTWWWYLLVALLGLAFAAGLHAFLTRRIQRQRRLLEAEVARRTKEIIRQKEALEEANVQLGDMNQRLEDMSSSDLLTGLRNRRFLMQHMDSDVTLCLRRHDAGGDLQAADLAFYMVDLDHFKSVNDLHGHAAGDAVLAQIAQRLAQAIREFDYLVRWGGEEFLIVARDTHAANASELAARLCRAISGEPFGIGEGKALAKTCSVGFACFPFDRARPRGLSWTDVVDLADQALYMAKRGGRDTWVGLSAPPAADASRHDDAAWRALVLDAPRAVLGGDIALAGGKAADVLAALEEETRKGEREAAARAAGARVPARSGTA
jgi:diguanylate cyclase (GGDEF)-like protein